MRAVDRYVSFEVIVPNPECKICFSEFHEFRIPYLLKECGHTLCEVCAWKLVQRREKLFVVCPFCRKTTTSEDVENLLLMNHSIKEFMDENAKNKLID